MPLGPLVPHKALWVGAQPGSPLRCTETLGREKSFFTGQGKPEKDTAKRPF